ARGETPEAGCRRRQRCPLPLTHHELGESERRTLVVRAAIREPGTVDDDREHRVRARSERNAGRLEVGERELPALRDATRSLAVERDPDLRALRELARRDAYLVARSPERLEL